MDVGAFGWSKPFSVFGEVGQEEEEDKGDHAGEDTFEDENPAPAAVGLHVIHFANCGSEKTT